MESTAANKTQAKQRDATVDSFRGLAAFAIIFSHINYCLQGSDIPSALAYKQSFSSLLHYLFQGSSTYFMVITGFVLASRLPAWKNDPSGYFVRAAQRMTKILTIFWTALVIIMGINLIRYAFFGTMWVKPTLVEVFSQFFLFSSYFRTDQLYVASCWYLEADFLLFITVVFTYYGWSRLSIDWQRYLKPLVFISTIVLVFSVVYVDSLNLFSGYFYNPVRLSSYFILGFLAWHARKHASALFALIVCSMLILFWTDRTALHKHLYTSNAVVLAFIFLVSYYSAPLKLLCKHPLVAGLYKINFGIFLFNMIAIRFAVSLARNVAPTSTTALFFFISLSVCALFVGCYFFEKHIQRPLLAWHDRAWKTQLPNAQAISGECSENSSGRVTVIAQNHSHTEFQPAQANGR